MEEVAPGESGGRRREVCVGGSEKVTLPEWARVGEHETFGSGN